VDADVDVDVAIPRQSRADRIALLSGALAAVNRPRMFALLYFPGSPRGTGIDVRVDLLPGGWVCTTVWPGHVRERVWELSPAHTRVVGEIVDAIQVVLDESLVPPAVEWWMSPPQEPYRVQDESPPDEPWVEEATEPDLRERLVRLAGLRGGRILARFPGRSATIVISARLRGDTIIVDATSLGVSETSDQRWKARWTLPRGGSSAARILVELKQALRLLSPPESSGQVAVRLEQHDFDQADPSSMVAFGAWLISLPVALFLGVAAALLGATGGLFSELDHFRTGSRFDTGIGFALMVAVALSAYLAAAFVAWAVDRLSQRSGWRESTAVIVEFAAALAGSVAYFGLVFVAGDAWRLVLAAPWVLWLGTAVLRRLRRVQ
jgi:hypothetical protein